MERGYETLFDNLVCVDEIMMNDFYLINMDYSGVGREIRTLY